MPERIPGTNRWILDDDDVVHEAKTHPLYSPHTFVVEDFRRHLNIQNSDKGVGCAVYKNGASCKLHAVMNSPVNWVSGKIRLVLEFEPDDSNELDDSDSEILEIEADITESNSLQLPEASQALEEIRRLGSQ